MRLSPVHVPAATEPGTVISNLAFSLLIEQVPEEFPSSSPLQVAVPDTEAVRVSLLYAAPAILPAIKAAATPSLGAELVPTTTFATGAPLSSTSVVEPNISPANAAELAKIVAPATMAPIFFRFTFMVSPII